jgi:hypothetical protein
MEFKSFAEFYPFYLTEHSQVMTRRLHFVGTLGALLFAIYFVITWKLWAFIAIFVCGYGFAWIAHVFVEKNKPATFTHPWYSLLGDFVMFKDILTGKIKF